MTTSAVETAVADIAAGLADKLTRYRLVALPPAVEGGSPMIAWCCPEHQLASVIADLRLVDGEAVADQSELTVADILVSVFDHEEEAHRGEAADE